ncbi:hypothetical protein ACOME3_010463 [Neoechinorhynchus agilis]
MTSEKITINQPKSILRIPHQWLNTAPMSSYLINDRFIVCKTPLSSQYDSLIPEAKRFTPAIAINRMHQIAENRSIAGIISLINNEEYYQSKEFTDHFNVLHYSLPCDEHKDYPRKEIKNRFMEICDSLLESKPNSVIAVHCTRGYNQSGFLISSYLIEKKKMKLRSAIAEFRRCRAPGIQAPRVIHGLRLRYSSWRTGVLLKRKIDTKDPASTKNSTEAVSIETSTNYGSKQEANDVIDIAGIKRKKIAGGRKRSISDSDEHSIRSKRRVSQSSADHQTELNASLKTQIIKEEDEHMKSRKRSNEDIGFRKRSNQMAQTTDSETREQSPRRKRVAVDPKSADFKSKRKIDALAEKPNPSILDSSNEEVNQPTGLSEGFSVDVPFIYRLRYDRDRRKINEIRQNIKDLCPESHGRGFIGSQPVSMTLNNIQTLRQLDYRVSWKDDGTRYLCLIRAKNEIYMVDRRNSIFKVRNLTFVTKRGIKDHLRQTLLDGEMVEDVVEGKRIPRFLIFDVLAFNGHPAGKELDFDKRLELILREIILPRHRAMECGAIDRSREPFGIRRKDFYGLKHSKHLLNEKFKREVPHETDGLIFQPVYMPYIFGTFYELLKYKPPRLNSVDFKLVIPGHVMEKRKIGSGGFLYVRKYNEPFARIRLTAQLFQCNEKIIECVVERGEWKMIRVRNDKDIANTFQTAMAIKESIERPVTEDLLFRTITTIDPKLFYIHSLEDYNRVDEEAAKRLDENAGNFQGEN